MSDFTDPAKAPSDGAGAIPTTDPGMPPAPPVPTDSLIVPPVDIPSVSPDPVVPPAPPEPVLPQLAVEPTPAPTGLPPETSATLPPMPPPSDPNETLKPKKKGMGKGLLVSLLLLLVALPFGVLYISKTGTGLFDTRNRAASAEPCKVCSSAKKCVTVASGASCSSQYNECSTDASCGGTTTAPYCSSTKCPYGCTSNTTSGGNCKSPPANTTAPPANTTTPPKVCTGGSPICSAGKCYKVAGKVCPFNAQQCCDLEVPVSNCGAPCNPAATIAPPSVTYPPNATVAPSCPATVSCNCPGGARTVCNNVIRENPWFGDCAKWCGNPNGTPTPAPPTVTVIKTCTCRSDAADYVSCMTTCTGSAPSTGDKKCTISATGVDSCAQWGMQCHCQDGNACTKTACEPNSQNATSCATQGRSWCMNQGGYAHTCCVAGYTCCSGYNGCCQTGSTSTPRLTNPPTNPPVTGECLAIKAYKGTTLLDATSLSKLKPGDVITFAVKGSNNPSKAHFKINGAATWEESTTKNAGGEFVSANYTIPSDKVNFTIAAEVFVDNAWK